MKTVLFVTRVVQAYRESFHDLVRALLAEAGVRYDVVQGEAEEMHQLKGDTIQLPWASTLRNRFVGPRHRELIWQPLLRDVQAYDLVIVGQENKYLTNYFLQLGRGRIFPKIALWGHGRNFQARDPNSRAEQWKRYWAVRCDWWFGYTDETRRHLEQLGFPSDQITVFNNSVDTSGLAAVAESIDDSESAAAALAIGAQGNNIAIFVGSLYPDKRLEFMIKAADCVRARVPDFTLIVVGGGVDKSMLDALALTRPWLIVAGPKFGREKVALMRAAKLFLMPGLVGLAVLDAAAIGLPMVTTAYPFHSPEIAYLRDGENGVVVQDWQNVDAYAEAVTRLMLDPVRRSRLSVATRRMAAAYTVEAMAERFAGGIVQALAHNVRQ